jgi:DNA-binding NarL/FixJ family response regulator
MEGTRGSQEPVRVIVIDTDPVARRVLTLALHSADTRETIVREAGNIAEACCLLEEAVFAGAVASLDFNGADDVVSELRRAGLKGPIVATSRNGSV